MSFHCTQCGACCRQLHLFGPMYAWLADSDGVCKYFDRQHNTCSVYAYRPLICRVDDGYTYYFREHVSYADYIALTEQACRRLQASLKANHGKSC